MTDDLEAQVRAQARAERAERLAREGAQAMADHKAALRAVDERTARLRALRLAKAAEGAKAEAESAVIRPARKRAPKRSPKG